MQIYYIHLPIFGQNMNMKNTICPKCSSDQNVKSGVINDMQRFKCKNCNYHFTIEKIGKSIDSYYVIKALQLYIEGVTYREIERILGVSHVSVINWVKKYNIKTPEFVEYSPTYKVMTRNELTMAFEDHQFLKNASMIVTELGDKFMVIKWKRKM